MDQVPQQEPIAEMGTPTPEKKSSTLFIVLGIAVVVFTLFAWFAMMNPTAPMPDTTTDSTQLPENPEDVTVGADDAATTALGAQGTSDETAAIEADLKATDLNALNDIDKI